jgi:hypothetical protein
MEGRLSVAAAARDCAAYEVVAAGYKAEEADETVRIAVASSSPYLLICI